MLTTPPVSNLLTTPSLHGGPVRHRGGPRAIDFFCGMGGSSTGLARAGFDVALAANHWDRAIETHSANHPDTDHWNADLSAYNMTCLPDAEVLWASPICTEVSPAGGRKKRTAQMDMFEDMGHVPDAAFERTRITFWEVIRACEVRRFPIVLIENVVEAADWELFDVWLQAMAALGYEYQFVSVSAAHVGSETNPYAPQLRDRVYIVFNRVGMRRPDVDPRPLARCFECGEDVRAVQWWKKQGRRIGKYRQQYVYVCPNPRKHEQPIIEPYVVPAAAAIEWDVPGIRIGDRELHGMRPLSAATLRRVQTGLDTIGNPARAAYVSMLRNHGGSHNVNTEALATFSAGGFHHALTVPPGAFISKHHGGLDYKGIAHMNKDVTSEPFPTIVTQVNNSLVIPYRKGSKPYPVTAGALSTVATIEAHALATLPDTAPVTVEDCYLRMLLPREAANAQAFPRDYVMVGNQGEQQMQAGNAVATNVSCWLGEATMAVLDAA